MSNGLNGFDETNMRSWPLNDPTAETIILSPEEEEKRAIELKSMQAVKYALKNYRKCSYVHVNKCEMFLHNLPNKQQQILFSYKQHLDNVRDRIDRNQDVINEILRVTDDLYRIPDTNGAGIKLNPQEVEKAQSCLKLIARDWSDECAAEREQSYKPIIDAIVEYFPPERYEPNEVKVLVPGAGLGRLTYELASRGYECEGNEFSLFMLMISYFILNHCKISKAYSIYPWVHQYVNNLNASDQNASIQFPDICPAANPTKGKISISAGDFLEICNEKNKYDCVATCFFIDCANNIVDFIETIYKILVPGGLWVNLGPLLYHYSEVQGENSIEPSYDQLLPIIEMIGFKILRTKTGLRTKYAQPPHSMAKNEYESVFWICQKPLDINGESDGCYSDDMDFGTATNNNNNLYESNNIRLQRNGFKHK